MGQESTETAQPGTTTRAIAGAVWSMGLLAVLLPLRLVSATVISRTGDADGIQVFGFWTYLNMLGMLLPSLFLFGGPRVLVYFLPKCAEGSHRRFVLMFGALAMGSTLLGLAIVLVFPALRRGDVLRAGEPDRGVGLDGPCVPSGPAGGVARFYRAADLFVLPSTYEGFGSVYLEAFASGLGCVAIRRRDPVYKVAADEIIEHGRTGFLIDEDDPRLLANALRYAHDHPDEMRRWGENARQVARARYTWDHCIDELLTLTRTCARPPRA